MPKFRVEGWIQVTTSVFDEIEADNEDDAINKTYFHYEGTGKVNDFDFDDTEIKEG